MSTRETAQADAQTAERKLLEASKAMGLVARHLGHRTAFNASGAHEALDTVDNALDVVQAARERVGAVVNSLLTTRQKAHQEQADFDKRQMENQERTGGGIDLAASRVE